MFAYPRNCTLRGNIRHETHYNALPDFTDESMYDSYELLVL